MHGKWQTYPLHKAVFWFPGIADTSVFLKDVDLSCQQSTQFVTDTAAVLVHTGPSVTFSPATQITPLVGCDLLHHTKQGFRIDMAVWNHQQVFGQSVEGRVPGLVSGWVLHPLHGCPTHVPPGQTLAGRPHQRTDSYNTPCSEHPWSRVM